MTVAPDVVLTEARSVNNIYVPAAGLLVTLNSLTGTGGNLTITSGATVNATNAHGIYAVTGNGFISLLNTGAVTSDTGHGIYADGNCGVWNGAGYCELAPQRQRSP